MTQATIKFVVPELKLNEWPASIPDYVLQELIGELLRYVRAEDSPLE